MHQGRSMLGEAELSGPKQWPGMTYCCYASAEGIIAYTATRINDFKISRYESDIRPVGFLISKAMEEIKIRWFKNSHQEHQNCEYTPCIIFAADETSITF